MLYSQYQSRAVAAVAAAAAAAETAAAAEAAAAAAAAATVVAGEVVEVLLLVKMLFHGYPKNGKLTRRYLCSLDEYGVVSEHGLQVCE